MSNFPSPDAVTQALVQQTAGAVGNLIGWDFSRMKTDREGQPWRYTDVVSAYVKPEDHVLDVGTGGGELFLSLAHLFAQGVAVDHSARQITTALANKAKAGNTNIAFQVMEASQLDFPLSSFDLVLTSHLKIYPAQVAKMLRPNGYFITEIVGRRTHLNLLEAFGYTPDDFGPDWWQERVELVAQFAAVGCRLIAQGEMEVPYWITDFDSLIFYLKSVPWPDDDNFDIVKQWRGVQRILERHVSPRGVETSDHYELVIVRKQD